MDVDDLTVSMCASMFVCLYLVTDYVFICLYMFLFKNNNRTRKKRSFVHFGYKTSAVVAVSGFYGGQKK